MDYNNIDNCLKRIYASVNSMKKYGGEVLSGIHTETTEKSEGRFMLTISFGREEGARNQIQNVISNLANLKDILKTQMETRGKNKNLIEDEIEKSLTLQLVLDLSNQEKHGYPLTKTRRTKKDPIISNLQIGISPSDRPDNITYAASNGTKALNVMISINADVIDSSGIKICTLDQLIDQAVNDWEEIINNFNLASQGQDSK